MSNLKFWGTVMVLIVLPMILISILANDNNLKVLITLLLGGLISLVGMATFGTIVGKDKGE